MKNRLAAFVLCVIFCFAAGGCSVKLDDSEAAAISVSDVPEYSSSAYVEINGNVPDFADSDMAAESFEKYGELDELGRCTTAYACIGTDIMPTEERGSIGSVKPTGWHTVKYDCVDGKYLYNRCHLIGYQLTGENKNEKNLITGTRYLNTEGMLPFENMVADYVKETENHVLYRATPIFEDDNLLASGVQLEAKSVEDGGEGICFNVYCYNVQPSITIDYKTGDSSESGSVSEDTSADDSRGESSSSEASVYILNTSTKKFHLESCSYAEKLSSDVRSEYSGSREDLIADGYEPCKRCSP